LDIHSSSLTKAFLQHPQHRPLYFVQFYQIPDIFRRPLSSVIRLLLSVICRPAAALCLLALRSPDVFYLDEGGFLFYPPMADLLSFLLFSFLIFYNCLPDPRRPGRR